MELYILGIIGVLFLALGVYFAMGSSGSAGSKAKTEEAPSATAETAASEEKQDDAASAAKREEQLKSVVVPGNIPEVAIYFGS